MRQRIWIIVAAVCVFAAMLAVWVKSIGQDGSLAREAFAGKDKISCGKSIRNKTEKKKVIPGINLTRLEEQEEEQKKTQIEDRQKKFIAEHIAQMTLEQKLAQMMILTNEKDMTVEKLKKLQPGGVIFFGVDYEGKTVQEVETRVQGLQACAEYPFFIGVDEEGGKVSRIAGLDAEEPHRFTGARALYRKGIGQVKKETKDKSVLLKKMGMNLNFDPVADVVESPKSYMYERSASGDAGEVAEYTEAVVEVMRRQNIGCCLKHFPGYGSHGNTHRRSAVDRRTLQEYEEKDFLPFRAGMAAGAEMVMVAHVVMEKVDGEYPASLSAKVHSLLREELGFSGVVIADDLNMKAVLNRMNLKEASERAIIAGNDMIFSADAETSLQGMMEAVREGRLTEKQIDESVERILQMKINLKLIAVE